MDSNLSFSIPDSYTLSKIDRALVVATQSGLPLTERPYLAIAEILGVSEKDVIFRLTKMQSEGLIRRIAAVPNHYRIGYKANGMTVWDIKDTDIQDVGRVIGELSYVSHCYQRPRYQPFWPYNLFAMVHGTCREEVEDRVNQMEKLLEESCRGHEIIYSTKVLKKTGLRLLNNKITVQDAFTKTESIKLNEDS